MQAAPAENQPVGAPATKPQGRGSIVGAVLLIVIGLVALVANLSGIQNAGDAIPLAVGLAFLAAYALTRAYGLLVAGGIVAGFGAGILAASLAGVTDNGFYVVLGGGLGFLLIYGVDVLVTRLTARWWPVLPGTAMVLIAGGIATGDQGLIREVGLWSPVILVVIGAWILLARSRAIKR